MKRKRVFKRIMLSLACIVLLTVIGVATYIGVVAGAATLDERKLDVHTHAAIVLDMHDQPMGRTDDYVSIDKVPKHLIDAFVAVEDKRFYQHHGLDYRRMAGAVLSNIRSGSFAEGASTISCQLIKNTHLTQEKTINRKIKEAKLALDLEKKYSKDEIMEKYLNIIYMGSGLYGVGAAARGFFAKQPAQLTLAECASIAATTVNPSKYSPKLNAENNIARRNMVLQLMCKQGYITQEECEKATEEQLTLRQTPADNGEAYRINALDEAARLCGIDVKALAGGYTIYTYCDPKAQQQTYDAMHSATLNGADSMAILADATGEVRAFHANFATPQACVRRQIGSTIKPFIYAAAVEQDLLLPDTILDDSPASFADYTPHNYHDIYRGSISARVALANSSNVAAVRVLTYTGIDRAVDLLNDVGLPISQKDKHLALALGGLTYGCTMDELTTAYCTLANGGMRNDAAFVRAVSQPNGSIIYTRTPQNRRVISKETAYLISDMLQETVRTGTAKRLSSLGIEMAAKTGTVEGAGGNADAWCAAYTPTTVAITWAGNLGMHRDKMTEISGGGTTCTMARHMMDGIQSTPFTLPQGIRQMEIDDYTYTQKGVLALASPNTPTRYRRKIHAKSTSRFGTSTLFETVPNVDCALAVENGAISLTLVPQELCSYLVRYDNGFETYCMDTLDSHSTLPVQYDILPGWWSVTPILHGKNDVEGAAYRVLIL